MKRPRNSLSTLKCVVMWRSYHQLRRGPFSQPGAAAAPGTVPRRRRNEGPLYEYAPRSGKPTQTERGCRPISRCMEDFRQQINFHLRNGSSSRSRSSPRETGDLFHVGSHSGSRRAGGDSLSNVRTDVNYVETVAGRPSTRNQARHHTLAHVAYPPTGWLLGGSFCLISMLTCVS
jgi:hypothetical protein